MKSCIHVFLIFSLLIETSGCVTSRAMVDYRGFDPQVKVNSGSVNGTELGPVRGNEGGEIWSSCSDKAADSLRALIAEAKEKGANAVGNLKWYATKDATPSCKSEFGLLMIWPLVLTPLFMSTEVEGTAYKVAGDSSSNGLIMIPTSQLEEEALIRRLATAQN